MSGFEIFNWLVFSMVMLFSGGAIIAYIKSDSIIKPARMPLSIFPEHFSLAYEPIQFSAEDGVFLKGWFIPSVEGESDKTIIICHGWGSNKGEIFRDTHFLSEKGYNLLYFDFRASGESKGVFSTIGYLERKDFNAAYEFLKTHKSEEAKTIGLLGLSMGSSVVIYAASKNKEIKCLVAENAFYSYTRVIANWSWLRMKMPYWPLVPMTLFFVRMKLKANPDEYSPRYNIGKVTRPILFVNAEHDDLVPIKDGKKLFNLCASEKKELWIVPGAIHAKCAEVSGENYRKKIINFFSDNL
ncbi:MAG: alpha/beta hydrolase [Elusimicrobiota bacterium]|nr:alpha/beta hydrolase [Elusimicrobiota bacterium]